MIRDWQNRHVHEYGAAGGKAYTDIVLKSTLAHNEDCLQRNIRSTFNELQGFLMPHPGLAVADESFDGRNSGNYTYRLFNSTKMSARLTLMIRTRES